MKDFEPNSAVTSCIKFPLNLIDFFELNRYFAWRRAVGPSPLHRQAGELSNVAN